MKIVEKWIYAKHLPLQKPEGMTDDFMMNDNNFNLKKRI
jgi:hypothetical protein